MKEIEIKKEMKNEIKYKEIKNEKKENRKWKKINNRNINKKEEEM